MSGTTVDTDVVTPLDVTHHWAAVSQNVVTSLLKTSREVLTAFKHESPSARSETDVSESCLDELSRTDLDWDTERSVETVDDLTVGDAVQFTKAFSNTDVTTFALSSGDTNRLHLEDAYAEETQFGGRIAHGTLVAGTISAALARFPGLTVYLSQDLEFQAPVEPGDTVTAECTIVEELDDSKYRLSTRVSDENGDSVIDGEAVVLIDEHPID